MRSLVLLVLAGVPLVAPFALPCSPLIIRRGAQATDSLPSVRLAGLAPGRNVRQVQGAASALSMAAAKKSALGKALIKVTGSLTVSTDFTTGDRALSKNLRKRCGISAIFTALDMLPMLGEEQKEAVGDFPGPCPIVLRETPEALADGSALDAAKSAGATGVVIPLPALGSAGAAELAAKVVDLGMEAVWEVQSVEQHAEAATAGAEAFLVTDVEGAFGVAPAFWAGLPKGAVVMAEILAEQEGNSELALGKSLHAAGCKSIVLKGALQGRLRDMKYVEAASNGLRSKGSSTFDMQGITGKASAVPKSMYNSQN